MNPFFTIRRAIPADSEDILAAHVDSISSLGALYYSAEVVNDWKVRLQADRYVKQMSEGQVFHVAVDDAGNVLGFSSYRREENQHRTAVYVRGVAARRHIGSALLRAAEVAAVSAGAQLIQVDASLGAIEFYRFNGFQEVCRAEHRSPSGTLMACALMQKHVGLAPISK